MYEYRPSTHQFYTFTIFKNGYQFLQVKSTEQQTKDTVTALNAWQEIQQAVQNDPDWAAGHEYPEWYTNLIRRLIDRDSSVKD